jgi:hypothetical protein
MASLQRAGWLSVYLQPRRSKLERKCKLLLLVMDISSCCKREIEKYTWVEVEESHLDCRIEKQVLMMQCLHVRPS